MEGLQTLDEAIILWVHSHMNCPFLDRMAKGISSLGDEGVIWITLAIGMVLLGILKKNELLKWGVLLLVCLGMTALVVNIIIKPHVARIRPYDQLGLDIIIPYLTDFSFPSGHTSAAFAAVAVFYRMNKRWGRYMLLFAVFMAISRLYLAVHYPSDIIVGAFLGLGISNLVLNLYFNRIKNR